MNARRIVNLDYTNLQTAARIMEVMRLAYQVEAEILGAVDFPPLYRTAEQIASTEDVSFIGIYIDEALAAVAELNFEVAGNLHIDSLVVRPECFRRGLGSALLQHAIDTYFTRTMSVSTGAANEPALLLYMSKGFCEHHRWTAPGGIAMITLKRAAGGD